MTQKTAASIAAELKLEPSALMTGATNVADGTPGDLPTPVAGEHEKSFLGSGVWGHPISERSDATGNQTTITTTSVTDVLATGMTITPAAGTYLVMFSTSLSNAAGADVSTISLYKDAARLPNTERMVSGTDQAGVATQAIIEVNGSEAISVYWKVSAGTGSMYSKSLTLVRVK